MLRIEAQNGDEAWPKFYSPRNPLWCNKLVEWRSYSDGNVTATTVGLATMEPTMGLSATTCVRGWLSFASGRCGSNESMSKDPMIV